MGIDRSFDDDLLPLSAFASPDFSPLELAKKRLLISQGEMMKLISDYERATSIELVCLVNENYNDFLKVSSDVTAVADKVSQLVQPAPPKYSRYRTDINSVLTNSRRVLAELSSLEEAQSDITLLNEILDVAELAESGLKSDRLDIDDLDILSSEYERVYAMVEATEAVLAAGVRRGSGFLRDSMPSVREELAKIQDSFVAKLSVELDRIVSSKSHISDDQIAHTSSIQRALVKLKSGGKFSNLLKAAYLSEIKLKSNLQTFYAEIDSKFLNPESPFYRIVSGTSPDLWVELLLRTVITEVTAQGSLAVFVPTGAKLEEFYTNYSSSKEFVAKILSLGHMSHSPPAWVSEFLGKFKTSIYFNLKARQFTEGVQNTSDQVVNVIVNDLFAATVVIEDSMIPKAARVMVEILERIRTAEDDSHLTVRMTRLRRMIDSVLPHLADAVMSQVSKLTTKHIPSELVGDLIKTQSDLFGISIGTMLHAMAAEVSGPIVQTLESVKQVSTLYRVASRGIPVRHSVYVELAMKPIAAFLASIGAVSTLTEDDRSWVVRSVGGRIADTCLSAFAGFVAELLSKEKARAKPSTPSPTSPPSELDKITCQLYFDCGKLIEFFSDPKFGNRRNEQLDSYLHEFQIVHAKFSTE